MTAKAPEATSTQTPVRRSDVRRTLLALLATALGVFPLNELFVDRGWMIDVWLAMIVVVAPAAWLRRNRSASVGQVWIGVVLLIPWLTLNFVRSDAVLGFIPLGGAWHEVGHLMSNLHRTTSHGVAPLHTTVAIRLALCALFGLIAALVDLIAVVGRRGALAGVPLLVAFTVAGAVPRHPVSWLWFVVAAIGFLILLALDSGDDLHRWGHYLPRTTGSRRPAAGAMSAPRIAVIAIVAAIVLPLFIPANSRNFVANLFHHHGGDSATGFGADAVNGSGSGGIDPFVSMFGELNRNTQIDLMSVHVSSNDAQFMRKGHQPFYLRTNVLPLFTGDGWRPGPDGTDDNIVGSQFDSSPGTPFAPTTLNFRAHITVKSLHSNPPVFASPSSISGLSDETEWSKQNQLLVGTTITAGTSFSETVDQPAPTKAQLAAANGSDPTLQPWLKLPTISKFVRDRTASIVRGAHSPYARAVAISNYFSAPANGFTYSLSAPRGDSGDALTDFLKNKVGYCQQYAATMAVMLRLAHVPSRVVLGYTHDVPNSHGTFTVTNFDAHSWVEAYFAGIGWVPFDPTPISGISGGNANDLPWAPHKQQDTKGAHETDPTVRRSVPTSIGARPTQPHGGGPIGARQPASGAAVPVTLIVVLVVIVAVIVALLVPAFLRWRRRRHRLGRARHGDTDALWRELSDTATDLGYVWSPARTPRQVARWLGGTSRDADDSLTTLTRAVELARYGPTAVLSDAPMQDAPVERAPQPDLVRELGVIEAGLRARRSTAERLRAVLWPASLNWSRVPILGRWLPGSTRGHRH